MGSREVTKRIRTVSYVARPMGRERENGPHLGDLRAFVAECDGLPDDLLVRIDPGHVHEGGRRDVTFTARQETELVGEATNGE